MFVVSRVRAAALFFCFLFILAFSVERAVAENDRVWDALKQGGKVVLLRHTHVQIQEGIGRLVPGNCAEEVNLTSRGVDQAKRIGEAFRAHGVAVGEVLTSPYCRCLDTGRLAFGRATPVEYLKPPGVLSEAQAKSNEKRVVDEILRHRGPANLVMITHDLNIANIVLEDTVPMGEFFVLQSNGRDFNVVGKLLIDDQ